MTRGLAFALLALLSPLVSSAQTTTSEEFVWDGPSCPVDIYKLTVERSVDAGVSWGPQAVTGSVSTLCTSVIEFDAPLPEGENTLRARFENPINPTRDRISGWSNEKVVTVVPEPGAFATLLTGAAALALAAKLRN